MDPQVTVVIPVFNGFEATRRCLEAVARNTPASCPVMVLDDGSTDPRIRPMLEKFVAGRLDPRLRGGDRLQVNEINQGFAGTVNRGIQESVGDVVVLNSDTIVPEGWVEGLVRCGDSDPAIGMVCPLSNAATILSLPGVADLFTAPGGAPDVEAIARCVADASVREYPRLPTAVGFCMLLTRKLIETAGVLDPAYGRGYGEECDLSMRALDVGFQIACCDDVYVHHESEASFGAVAGIEGLRERNARLLDRRWPMYSAGIRAWSLANPLRRVAERVVAAAERERLPGRPRVLQVLHRFDSRGGVEEHTRALVNSLKGDIAFTVALPSAQAPHWSDITDQRTAPHLRLVRFNSDLATEGIRVLGHRANVRDARIEDAFRALLSGGFDVVHFQSLVGWNTLALAQIARESGARVVMSTHDMAMMCGDYNMMSVADEQPCGRMAASAADAGCVSCLRAKSTALMGSPPVPTFIEERHAQAAAALAATDVVVCPSEFARERIGAAFGSDVAKRCEVLPHGVHAFAPLERHPERAPLTVAFVGRFTSRKGSAVVLQAARRLAGQRIIIEVHGPVDETLEPEARAAGLILRGSYNTSELQQRLRGVDLVVAPSTLEETFCLVAAEAQMLGIPVIATNAGAVQERIADGVNGFLIERGDSAGLAALLLRLRDDRSTLEAVAARVRSQPPVSIATNAAQYLALYRRLAAQRTASSSSVHAPDARLVQRIFGLPRRRGETRLGDERYDRWIVGEECTEAASDRPMDVVLIPGHGEAEADLAAVNRAIAASSGEWLAFVQAGDHLAPGALEGLAKCARENPAATLIYTDDDVVGIGGDRYDPAFKPIFDLELLRHEPYIAGLCAVRRADVLARGGLHASGWLGIVDYALRLGEEHRDARVVAIAGVLVHRADANVRALEHEDFRRRYREIVAAHLKRMGLRAMALTAVDDAPAMWAYAPASTAGVSVLVLARESPSTAAACVRSLLQRSRGRVGEIFIDADAATAAAAGVGSPVRVNPVESPAIAQALLRATAPWLVVVDARCVDFTPGWLERLEQGVAGSHVAAIGPHWEVLAGGRDSVAGAAPRRDASRLSALLHSPRQVSTLAPRVVMLRREAAVASHALDSMRHAGEYALTHLCLALRESGYVVVSRPFVAAKDEEAPSTRPSPKGEGEMSEGATWMHERWGKKLAEDPHFRKSLALDEPHPRPALRFPAVKTRARLCAFPFDRGGSGEMRVRQPCAALAQAGRCDVVIMPEHDSGRAPNAAAWKRLEPDVVYAFNFFHDHQLHSLSLARGFRILGMDDLLTDLPPGNPYAATIYRDIADRIRRALGQSDRLVVSSPALAEAYGSMAHDVRVVPNAIDLAHWATPAARRNTGERMRVGWAGAKQHLDDLRLLASVVEATAREIEWVFFGMCPPEMRRWVAEVHEMVPVALFPEALARMGLDAAVAPLADHPFNRAKSALKLYEYGALGLPVVATDIEPYRDSPATRVRTTDEWIDALRALALQPDRGRERGLAMRAWVEENHTLNHRLDAWASALALDR
ncbi:MAG TPA: glycosyltransferase [Usitatibacter sp.]|nr:glycosyltransferase [Usitatibacter sp.]